MTRAIWKSTLTSKRKTFTSTSAGSYLPHIHAVSCFPRGTAGLAVRGWRVPVNRPLYLDYNATTPLDPRVFEAMRPYFLEEIGNAGSRTHLYGQRAKEAAERARQQVADLLGARSDE